MLEIKVQTIKLQSIQPQKAHLLALIQWYRVYGVGNEIPVLGSIPNDKY